MKAIRFTSLAAALLVCATTATAQAPANNDCVNAAVATVGLTPYDTTMATDSGVLLDPATCFGTNNIFQDIWFTFTPATSGVFQIETVNNGNPTFDTKLAVYGVTTCPAMGTDVLGCDDDGGDGLQSLVTLVLTSGTPVLIRVGSFGPTTVESPGALQITAIIPPANDDCGNSIVAGVGSNLFDSNGASTDGLDLDPLVCDMSTSTNEQISNDIWYTFTAPTTDFYVFDTSTVTGGGGSAFDTRLAVYDQVTCPDDPALVLGCDDDQPSPFNLDASVTVALTMGQMVTVRVGSFSTVTGFGDMGDLFIGVAPPPPTPPANDDCVNAEVITAFGTYAWDNTLATTDGADLAGFCDIGSFGDDIIYDDVWFEYTPTVGGCTYISHLGLANFDSRIAVYNSSTCPDDPATVIGCSDEEVQPIATPFEAGLDIVLSAGTSYLIRVGNFNSSTTGGSAQMLIAAGPQAVLNDNGMQTGSTGCPPAPAFPEGCNGDGGNQMGCTDCPCGNNAPIGTIGGCVNSALSSSRLLPSGDTSVSLPSGDTSDLRFGISGAPPSAFCILNSGDNVAPQGMANPCFGLNSGAQSATFDGLRCAVGNTLRHGGRSADVNGEVGVTNNPWGGEGGPPVGLAQQGAGFTAGQTRHFQVIHRDDPLAVCTRGLNTTQSVEVTFTP